jgi:HK97 family phage major capsid protein
MPNPLRRSIDIGYKAAAEKGTFELAISSEAPYERFFGIEILRHSKSAVDLSRLADGRHPLLLGHDTEKQIGVIKRAWIGEDKKLRGEAKFSRSALGQEIRQDVEDEIRTLVSVGYMIDEIEEVESAGKDADGLEQWTPVRTLTGEEFEREMSALHGSAWNRAGPSAARAKGDTPPTFIVTRWQPFEASVVPVPADTTVGIGRSAGVETDLAPVVPAAPVIEPAPAIQATPAAPLILVEKRKMENVKTPAELEIERRDALMAIGQQYAKYLGPNDLADAIRNGRSVEAFKDLIIAKIESRHTDTSEIQVGLSPKEVKKYSLGRALIASVTGDWKNAGFERECSEAVSKIMGQEAEGFFLPPDVFRRDFNVGTATEAGNLVATDLRNDMYVDALRNSMVMGSLGVRVLAGLSSNLDLPRKATASTIGSATEIGSASETNPVTAKVTLSPKRMTAYVEVSKQALIQSGMSLEAMIRDDLIVGAAVNIEDQVINGTGTAPQMTGLRYTSGIGTVAAATNGAALTWDDLVDLEAACANANAEPDRYAGYLINTKIRGKAKKVQKGTNLPFVWDGGPQPLNGYRAAVSNNVKSNITQGTSTTVCSTLMFGSDWSMGVIGLFGAPDVVVDPYTKSDTGQVKITLNQFADFGLRQPATFAKREGILTT